MKKIVLFILCVFIISTSNVYAKEKITFSRCVDGDTFKITVDGEEVFVRMLAIDTPESVKPDTEAEYYGKEASDYTCNRLTNAKKIELEYDKNSDKTDKYGRILAWVFVDGKLLQSELVSKGYAEVAYLYNNYEYTDTLKSKEEYAKNEKLGIWSNKNNEEIEPDTENLAVIIITVLFLIFVLISKKVIKK